MKKGSVKSRDQVSSSHNKYVQYCLDTDRYTKATVKRPQELTSSGVKIPVYKSDRFIVDTANITPEALPFLFTLEGYPKKLLLYLVFFEVENTICKFKWNRGTLRRFKSYLALFDDIGNDGTIKQAIRTLIKANCVQNISRGMYMLNPLILRSSNKTTRRNLINDYSMLLLGKNRDAVVNFFPNY